jgi:tetratricopeptide (TPR) repeat protein
LDGRKAARLTMKSTYLKLFRSELSRLENQGGFRAVDDYLERCEDEFELIDYRVVVSLEKARLAFYIGEWELCLGLLDKVELHDHLLEPDERAQFFLLSSRLHQGYGDLNQSLAFLEMALAEAAAGSGLRQIEATLEMAALFHRIGEHERGTDFLDQAEKLLRTKSDSDLASRFAFEKGLVAVRGERLSEAEELFKQALSCLGPGEKPSVARGEGLRFLGILAALDSRPVDALELQKKALDCFIELPYRLGCAKAYNSIGQTCIQLARYEEAQFFLQRSEQICKEVGAEAERAMILGKLGLVFAKNGQYEKAITYQEQDLEISSRFGNFRALAFSLRNLGLSYKAKGDLGPAVKYLRDSRDRFAELEDFAFQVKADLDLVSALLEHDRVAEAFGFLEDAQGLLKERLEVTADHVHARYFAGVVALNTESYHRAEGLLWQALEMCQAFSMETRQADVHYQLARLYIAKNDKGAALEELRSVYRLARGHSLGTLLAKAVQMLHEIDPNALFEELLHPSF